MIGAAVAASVDIVAGTACRFIAHKRSKAESVEITSKAIALDEAISAYTAVATSGEMNVEFFHERDWQGVTINNFTRMLNDYMIWYRDRRRKSDLGYVSPMQYRKNLGLAA